MPDGTLSHPENEAATLRRAATACRNLVSNAAPDADWFKWVPAHLDGLAERICPQGASARSPE